VLSSYSGLVDFVKFGWGTSVVSSCLKEKIKFAHDCNVRVFMGGTLFEKCLVQGKLLEFTQLLSSLEVEWLEVSNGTIDLPNIEKAKYISALSQDFNVLSEVGYKDSERSLELSPIKWVEYINQDFSAGSKYVITEARESGTAGVCRPSGEVRVGLINELSEAGLPIEKLIFEAPNKKLQHYFISQFGHNVNLANIAFSDVIALETLRLGLRGDTLLASEDWIGSVEKKEAANA
jgi:phosphosulfolactate synthase